MDGKFNGRHISEATKSPIAAAHVVRRGQEARRNPLLIQAQQNEAKKHRNRLFRAFPAATPQTQRTPSKR